MADLDLSGVDFNQVLKRLTLHANRLFFALVGLAGSGVLSGLGVSPSDLAMQTVLKFIDPEDHTVAWKKQHDTPSTDAVLRFLRKVLHNDLLDLLRLSAHETTIILDAQPQEEEEEGTQRKLSLDEFASALASQEGRVIREQQHARLLSRLDDEPELRDLLAVQLDPDGYMARTNQEVAQLLETTVSDIENRKKRLNRRLLRIWQETSQDSAS